MTSPLHRPTPAYRRRPPTLAVVVAAALLAVACREPAPGAPAPPAAAPRARSEAVPLPAGDPRGGRTGAPQAAGVAATVQRVADGDSLSVAFADGRRGDVRLQGIDAPEAAQPGGREAAAHLRRLALGEPVELHLTGRDPYGRDVAVVFGAGGDLALAQLRAGHAWYNARYADEQEPAARASYAAAERAAREQRLGLWAAPAPVPPWDFKADRRAARDGGGPAAAASTEDRVVGNRKSRLYHLPGCPGHDAVSPRNAELFASEQAARAAGYRRAGNC